jgi:hypothetical protein
MKVRLFSLIICVLIALTCTSCKEEEPGPTSPPVSKWYASVKECEIQISGVTLQQQDGSGTYTEQFSRMYTFPATIKADLTIDLDSLVKRDYAFGGIDQTSAKAKLKIHLVLDSATMEIRSLSVNESGGFSVTGTRMINYSDWCALECDNSVYHAIAPLALPCRYEISGAKNDGFIRKAVHEMDGSIGTYRSPGMGGGYDWSYYSTKTTGFSVSSDTKIVVTLR